MSALDALHSQQSHSTRLQRTRGESQASSPGKEEYNNPIVLHPLIHILLSQKSGIFAFMTPLTKPNQHFLRIAKFWYYKPTCWKHLGEKKKNNTQNNNRQQCYALTLMGFRQWDPQIVTMFHQDRQLMFVIFKTLPSPPPRQLFCVVADTHSFFTGWDVEIRFAVAVTSAPQRLPGYSQQNCSLFLVRCHLLWLLLHIHHVDEICKLLSISSRCRHTCNEYRVTSIYYLHK